MSSRFRLREFLGKSFASQVELGFDGLHGNLQGRGNLPVLESLIGAQQDTVPHLLREMLDGLFDLLTPFPLDQTGEGMLPLWFDEIISIGFIQRHHDTLAFVGLIIADLVLPVICRDLVDPSSKRGFLAKQVPILIDTQKDFLGEILCLFYRESLSGEKIRHRSAVFLVVKLEGLVIDQRRTRISKISRQANWFLIELKRALE